MIEITHTSNSITVKGHAEYAARGRDIVCAGVSTLLQTLIYSVEDLTGDKIQYDISPAKAYIQFGDLTEYAQLLVKSFFIGVKLIADNYPDNVKLTEL